MLQAEKEEQVDEDEKKQEPPKLMQESFQEREEKILMFKKKKEIEQQLDMLKDYKDEEMRRDFYMKQIMASIYRSLEQLRTIEQEMELLKYQKTLPKKTEEEKKEEERKKQKEEIMKRIHDQQEQRIKFRDETMKQVKEVLHKKPLYKQYEEKYHETVEVPLLEQKKKHLEELRNFYRPIDNSELTEHAMKYE